jgi:geranylgeranyl pyrophosphate synthase
MASQSIRSNSADVEGAPGEAALRLGRGRTAVLEAQRMTAEKTAAMLEAQAAAGMALATGSSSRAAARKVVAPYRRRVKSNRRRLMRSLTSSR